MVKNAAALNVSRKDLSERLTGKTDTTHPDRC